MFDACFIIEEEGIRRENIYNIVKKLRINNVIPIHIKDITKMQLLQSGDITEETAELKSNDLNKIIKFKDRYLTLKEIKQNIVHRTIWQMIYKNNYDNVLILEESVTLKEEFKENFKEKINEIMLNAPKLFSIISLFDNGTVVNKCNEFFNYPLYQEETIKAYIINKVGVKKIFMEYPLIPIIYPLHILVNELRLSKKDIFVMKFPIFENGLNKMIQTFKPKLLSLPIKKSSTGINKAYILKINEKCKNLPTLISYLTNNLGMNCSVVESENEIWKKISSVESNTDGLVIRDASKLNIENIRDCFNDILVDLPEHYKFIGILAKKSYIKNPFRFSQYLDFVHPEMDLFSSYIISKNGAELLLSNKKISIDFLCREHNCFAYNKPLLYS